MKPALLVLALLIASSSFAQTVTPATLNIGGGSANINSSFNIDWSIGESAVIETYHGLNFYPNSTVGTDWNVTSGFLQPFFKNYRVSDPSVPEWNKGEIIIYPVPAADNINIDFKASTTGKISIQLLNTQGTLLDSRNFTQVSGFGIQSFNLLNKASGTYYFKIMLTEEGGKVLKHGTFKIEKIK